MTEMADANHVAVLKSGKAAWNAFRKGSRRLIPDLYRADLTGMLLEGFNLSQCNLGSCSLYRARLKGADLRRAYLERADLYAADLSEAKLFLAELGKSNLCEAVAQNADLTRADLRESDLSSANFSNAKLCSAALRGANLWRTNFSKADLRGANLKLTSLVACNLSRADISGAHVYGASVWSAILNDTKQEGLIITRRGQSKISVDNIELAQLLYLLIENKNLSSVIDSLTTQVVLILGRFSPTRKPILESIRNALRKSGLSPVIFDFEGPSSRDLTETVRTLAHLSMFVIADITEPISIPQELMAIVPNLPSVPVLPIIAEGEREYAMFPHFGRYPWVLEIVRYSSAAQISADIITKYLPLITAMRRPKII